MAMCVVAAVGVAPLPRVLAGRKPDYVTGLDFFDRAAPAFPTSTDRNVADKTRPHEI
jgi:hypothetical protein